MDDKSTVYIIIFGLRGSVMLNTAATTINTSQDIIKVNPHLTFEEVHEMRYSRYSK